MRTLEIQFVPQAASRRMLGAVLLAGSIVVVGISLWQYATATGKLDQVEAEIHSASAIAERRRAAPAAKAASPIPEQRVNAINSAIARLNIPWSELFSAFEQDTSKDLALLALLPDARKRVLVVQAEATNPRAMVNFVERLRAVPAFEDAFLVKHERRDQDTGQPYRFAVEIRWKEGG